MSHIHVCLVSDQPIPNLLGITHFRPEEILFITTEKMEEKNKTEAILNTIKRLGLGEKGLSKLIVKEDSILDCQRKIDNWIQGKEDSDFIVNLTCGTKIMSIAVYEYFKDFSSRMIYIPIPKNEFIMPFPIKKPVTPEKLALRLGVVDYLTAYGLNIMNEKKLINYYKECFDRKDLSEWIVCKYDSVKNLLIWLSGCLRSHRNDKKGFILKGEFNGATDNENDLLKKLNFQYDGKTVIKNLNKSEIKYLTGGWLEEFCFNVVAEFIGKGIDNVVIGLVIKNVQNRDNEFDIMFTKDNALYFIECKSLDQHDDKNVEVLYKIGALQKDFGLRVSSFLVTTSPYILKEGRLRQSVQARAEQFNTEIIPPQDVMNFKKILMEKLNLK